MLIIYSTLGCHLCDHALAIVHSVDEYRIQYKIVDIAEDEALMETYGVRIPVIKDSHTDREIGWPFDKKTFLDWYRELSQADNS